ncbi:MAG: TetR/AcrR family transcriptional regulator [Myxococcota bacterium]
MAGRGAKRPPYHRGNVPATLVTATLELVEQSGVASATMRAVARRVELSHAAATHHFGKLENLLGAAATEVYQRLAATLEEAGTHGEDALARFRSMGCAYIGFAIAHPGWMQLLEHPLLLSQAESEPLVRAARLARDVLQRGLDAGFEDGPMTRHPGGDAAVLAWSTVHGFAKLASTGKLFAVDDADALERAVDALMTSMFFGLRGPVPGVDGEPGTAGSSG